MNEFATNEDGDKPAGDEIDYHGHSERIFDLGKRIIANRGFPDLSTATSQGHTAFDINNLRDIRSEDMPRIEQAYQSSLISDGVIHAIKYSSTSEVQSLLASGNGGMLHSFREPPRHPKNRKLLSVGDEMEQRLRQSEAILRQRRKKKAVSAIRSRQGRYGKSPAIYEGKMLVDSGDTRVLAWATWTRSLQTAKRRDARNDEAVAEVRDTVRGITMLSGVSRMKDYNRILLFDTLNGVERGAASAMFYALLDYWIDELEYKWILLYRHKQMRAVGKRGAILERHQPVGNNDASERFFRQRGLVEIGEQPSPVYAKREVGDEEIRIRATFGWMLGDLEEVRRKCKGLHEKYRGILNK